MNTAKRASSLVIVSVLLFNCASMFCQISKAGLGDSEQSVEGDRKALKGFRHISSSRSAYTIHEIMNDGLDIKEYVSPGGVVFGFSWSGVNHPDLSTLMSSYFGEYEKASKHTVRIRGQRAHGIVQSQNVIVEKFGHMRGARGKAYVPALMPEGMTADEIQ